MASFSTTAPLLAFLGQFFLFSVSKLRNDVIFCKNTSLSVLVIQQSTSSVHCTAPSIILFLSNRTFYAIWQDIFSLSLAFKAIFRRLSTVYGHPASQGLTIYRFKSFLCSYFIFFRMMPLLSSVLLSSYNIGCPNKFWKSWKYFLSN